MTTLDSPRATATARAEAPQADAQRVPVSIETQFALRVPSDPQISPDGERVAFVLGEWVANLPRARARIWLVDTAGGEPRPLTNGPRGDTCPRWSPDGRQLAFCSERDGDYGRPQLYVMPLDGGQPRRICAMPNGVAELSWSPDGSSIAFLSMEGAPPAPEAVVVPPERHRRLWRVRLDSDTPTPVSPAHLTVWRFAWSPAADRFAVYFAQAPGETGWYQGQLGIVPAEGGAVRQIGRLSGQAAALAWSPDGAELAYVAGDWSDRPLVGATCG